MLRFVLLLLAACGFQKAVDQVVPDAAASPDAPPTANTCSVHHIVFGAYTGVCLEDWTSFFLVPRGDCLSETARCVPCNVQGRSTGAPGC